MDWNIRLFADKHTPVEDQIAHSQLIVYHRLSKTFELYYLVLERKKKEKMREGEREREGGREGEGGREY